MKKPVGPRETSFHSPAAASPDLAFPALLDSYLKNRSIDRKEFVKKMGYENMTRGLRRFDRYRAGDRFPEEPDQFRRLSNALERPEEELRELVEADRERLREHRKREAREKRRRDGRYHIWIQYYKYVAGSRRYLDEELSEAEAVDRARQIAREEGKDRPDTPPREGGFLLRLNTPDLRTYTFDASGSVIAVYEDDVSPVKEAMWVT